MFDRKYNVSANTGKQTLHYHQIEFWRNALSIESILDSRLFSTAKLRILSKTGKMCPSCHWDDLWISCGFLIKLVGQLNWTRTSLRRPQMFPVEKSIRRAHIATLHLIVANLNVKLMILPLSLVKIQINWMSMEYQYLGD